MLFLIICSVLLLSAVVFMVMFYVHSNQSRYSGKTVLVLGIFSSFLFILSATSPVFLFSPNEYKTIDKLERLSSDSLVFVNNGRVTFKTDGGNGNKATVDEKNVVFKNDVNSLESNYIYILTERYSFFGQDVPFIDDIRNYEIHVPKDTIIR